MASLQDILNTNVEGLSYLGTPFCLLLGAISLLITGSFSQSKLIINVLYGLVLFCSFWFVSWESVDLFLGQVKFNPFSTTIQSLCLGVALSLLFFRDFRNEPFEYHFLILALLLGSLLMTISSHLLLIYLSVELVSLSAYMLTALPLRKRSFEAGLKYLIIGGIGSAVMLYGISLIYGFDQTFLLSGISTGDDWRLLGWLFLLVGVFFKISLFPMHLWVPNAYQGASTTTAAIFSIVPKLCGLVLLHNIIQAAGHSIFDDLLLVLALVTVLVGTFAAIFQKEVKRLIAYGAIAHTGFMMPLVLPGFQSGEQFIIYASVYALMNVSVFYFISLHEKDGELWLESLNGLGKFSPWLGVAGLVVVVALVGLPPTAGFSIKLLLFTTVWGVYESTKSPVILCYFMGGIFSTVVALFYYLRIPYHYFLVVEERSSGTKVAFVSVALTTILAASLLWLFIEPDIFNNFVVILGKP